MADLPELLAQHTLQVAVLRVRRDQVSDEYNQARLAAEKTYRTARLAGISQVKPRLPSGADAGRLSIKEGETVVSWDEELLLRVVGEATPEHVEDYVQPIALTDRRVIELLREHFPELVGRRVTATRRGELTEEVKATRGKLLSVASGEIVQAATVETHDPTGEFAYTPGKPGTAAILAALKSGEVTQDGRPAAAANPAAATAPEAGEPRGA